MRIINFIFLTIFSFSVFSRELPDFTEIYEKQGAAVVNINTTQTVKNNDSFSGMEGDPFAEFFRQFGPLRRGAPKEFKNRSLGSGFIWEKDGYILTNAHVVKNADEIKVKLPDKREFKAELVGADERTDVALLKIDARNLPTVKIGNAEKSKVGEWVVAIGSPLGLDNTVTSGIISAKGRNFANEDLVPFLQTNVAVNPGNSGGPLFNMAGEVIGINSKIVSNNGGYIGYSFAIPIDIAVDVANQFRKYGKISRGRLGVAIQEVDTELAASLGLEKAQGALVTAVEPQSAADKAGLRIGDVIIRFNQSFIEKSTDLPRAVTQARPGSVSKLQIIRQGKLMELVSEVGETNDESDDYSPRKSNDGKHEQIKGLGLKFRELSTNDKKELRVNWALQVLSVDGYLADSGIRSGDLIIGLANQDIKTTDQFVKLMKEAKVGSNIAFIIRRQQNTVFIPVKVPDGK